MDIEMLLDIVVPIGCALLLFMVVGVFITIWKRVHQLPGESCASGDYWTGYAVTLREEQSINPNLIVFGPVANLADMGTVVGCGNAVYFLPQRISLPFFVGQSIDIRKIVDRQGRIRYKVVPVKRVTSQEAFSELA